MRFLQGTRDNPNLIVYKDQISGIIFIKDFYLGEAKTDTVNSIVNDLVDDF